MHAPALFVAGVCGGLRTDLCAGDVVVADELLTDEVTIDEAHAGLDGAVTGPPVRLGRAGAIATILRRRGLSVRVGALVSTSRIATGRRRARLARTGALGVDLESAWLLARASRPAIGPPGRALACVRVVADSIRGAVLSPLTLRGLYRALSILPEVAAGLAEWAAVQAVGPANPHGHANATEQVHATDDITPAEEVRPD